MTPSNSTESKPRGGCCGCLLKGSLVLIVLIAIVGVGTFLAFQSGVLSEGRVWSLLGEPPAPIEIDNFRDHAIEVSITMLESDSSSGKGSTHTDHFGLQPFDVVHYQIVELADYRVVFSDSLANGSGHLGSCTIESDLIESHQFVVLPDHIIVHRVGAPYPPLIGTHYLIDNSPLCH